MDWFCHNFCNISNLFLGFLQHFKSVSWILATFPICFLDFCKLHHSVAWIFTTFAICLGIFTTFAICFLDFYNLCDLFLGFLQHFPPVSWLLVQLIRHFLLVNSRPKPLLVIQISSNIQSWFNRVQSSKLDIYKIQQSTLDVDLLIFCDKTQDCSTASFSLGKR